MNRDAPFATKDQSIEQDQSLEPSNEPQDPRVNPNGHKHLQLNNIEVDKFREKARSRERTRRFINVVSVILIFLGVILLVLSSLLPDNIWRDLSLGIGFALAPSGVFGFLADYLIFGRFLEDVDENIVDLGDKTKELGDEIAALQVSTEFLKRSSELGLEMIYYDRATALNEFVKLMLEEARRQNGKLYIVGSSVRGLIENVDNIGTVIQDALENKCDLRILITHPEYSHFRENQEDRPTGAIEDEIFEGIRSLEAHTKVKYPHPPDKKIWEHVKMYKGTPTCFMIVAGNHMLVNPYPYEEEAFRSFCIMVRKVEGGTAYEEGRTIYSQYIRAHLEKPWKRNAVGYRHFWLEGPDPTQAWDRESCYGDVFVVQNASHFYLTIYLNGNRKASYRGMPTSVPCKSGDNDFLFLPSSFRVCLFDKEKWVELDQTQSLTEMTPTDNLALSPEMQQSKDNSSHLLKLHPERRRGKISFRVKGHFMNDYSWVGLFDQEGKTVNPNCFSENEISPLQSQPMPYFYVQTHRPLETTTSNNGNKQD